MTDKSFQITATFLTISNAGDAVLSPPVNWLSVAETNGDAVPGGSHRCRDHYDCAVWHGYDRVYHHHVAHQQQRP